MTITVQMSKEEFLDYNNFIDYKRNVKCGIIELNGYINDFYHFLLDEGIWKDNNKCDKLIKKINSSISTLEGSLKDDNSNTQTEGI